MPHVIIQLCSDHLFDAEGSECTARFAKGMQPRGDGYYVLFDALPAPGSPGPTDAVVAGPFVRLRNAEEAAAEIERRAAPSGAVNAGQTSPGERHVGTAIT